MRSTNETLLVEPAVGLETSPKVCLQETREGLRFDGGSKDTWVLADAAAREHNDSLGEATQIGVAEKEAVC